MCSIFAAQPCKAKRVSKEIFDNSIRDNYQVDRDRILYSKAFRRLRGKTQIFIAGYDDHVRNRLSHTLEVSQIAQTISKALNLNEMLTEAIALGHDIGHTPFGHVGERTLHRISTGELKLPEKIEIQKNELSGFKHNWQSVRVASVLEYHNRDFAGLNLTTETLWGFLHHSKLRYGVSAVDFYEKNYSSLLPNEECWTFEAIVVSLADEIAQRHHDIEDGLITGILDKDKLIEYLQKEIFNEIDNAHVEKFKDLLTKAKEEKYPEFYLETLARAIINFYVCVVVNCTKELFSKLESDYSLTDSNSFYSKKKEIWKDFIISERDFVKQMMSKALSDADTKLQEDYFKKRILHCYQAQKNDGKAAYVIKKIVEAYMTNPQQMPDNAIIMLFANVNGIDKIDKQQQVMKDVFAKGKDKSEIVGEFRVKLADAMLQAETWKQNELYKALPRTIIDYIAGMTDDYALAIYEQLYGGAKQNRY